MLTVQNLPPDVEPTLADWFQDNRGNVMGQALFAVAVLCLAALGQPSDAQSEGWFYLGLMSAGLL